MIKLMIRERLNYFKKLFKKFNITSLNQLSSFIENNTVKMILRMYSKCNMYICSSNNIHFVF